jgi:hypothetical protein
MNLDQQPVQPVKTPSSYADPVLAELWRVKDARAAKFGDAAGLMRHLQQKYGARG